ncbi:MAG: cellulase family glycosylhydrolase [bacterium]|nr:cellulase family glycosylhydrolase [bacterium]
MKISKKKVAWFFLFVIIIVGLFGGYYFWDTYGNNPYSDQEKLFGVTYSTKYAKELDLDWQEAYLAVLDDLKVKLIRIPVYWDEIEQEEGNIILDDVAWMMDEASARDVRVILAIGQRVPRWPECHPPAWAKNLPKTQLEDAELLMLTNVVEKFRDHSALDRWQVQNEPFLSFFGECPKPDDDFIISSVWTVRNLDANHKIIVTDSGELSTWASAAELGDELGISMYRVTWNRWFGYFYYPLPPSYYTNKSIFIKNYVDNVLVSELQAEPWVSGPIKDVPLNEQYRSMDEDSFMNNVDFVRRTNFSEVLLWGVEWWYWLKEKQDTDVMWETARPLFY